MSDNDMFDAFADDSDAEVEDKQSPEVEEDEQEEEEEEQQMEEADEQDEDMEQGEEDEEEEADEEEGEEDEQDEDMEQEEEEADEQDEDMEEQEEEEEEEEEPVAPKSEPKSKPKSKGKLPSRGKQMHRRRVSNVSSAGDPCRAFRPGPMRRLMTTRVGILDTTSRRGNRIRLVRAVPRVNDLAARLMSYYLWSRVKGIMKTAYLLARHGKRKMVTTKDVMRAIERENDIKIAQ